MTRSTAFGVGPLPQARRMYGLTILSPRATAVVGMLRGARTAAAGGIRGLAGGVR
jgi:hypothetical protein